MVSYIFLICERITLRKRIYHSLYLYYIGIAVAIILAEIWYSGVRIICLLLNG